MDVLMPQLGETVTEGKIISWMKALGDTVAPGDVLFEIETDKASMEITATSAGPITDIRVKAGDVAPVGAVVAVIAGEGPSAAPAPAVSPAPPLIAAVPSARATAAAQPVKRALDPFNAVRTPERNFGPATLPSGARITPLARRLAVEAGVDPGSVTGSGPHGRVVANDIRAAAVKPAPAAAAPVAALASAASADQVMALYADVPFEELPLDGMRRTIAKRLVESKQTVPHFYLTADVWLEALLAIRTQINAARDLKISVNDFVVKAYALALRQVPAANAVWAEDRILRFNQSDVGVAVAVDGGLFTPVIRQAETKTLSGLSAEIRDLAARARDRKLKPADYQGGSASVSNLGMFGVRSFSAIINPPQSTILAVGAGERRPQETPEGGVRFSSVMTVTLSCDHRVVDGALGAQLLAAFKALIENPFAILI